MRPAVAAGNSCMCRDAARATVGRTPPLCDLRDPRYDVGAVPFDPQPAAPRPARPLTRRQVSVLYPGDPRALYETPMLGWALAFYGSYLLLCFGVLPGWAFGLLGFSFILRYFNRWHEAMHADQRGLSARHPARSLLVIMGPLYLGRREMEAMHLAHHRTDGGPGDPDRARMVPSLATSLPACVFEPELSVIWHVREHGMSAALLARMTAHALVWAGLMSLGGWAGLIAYNCVTRAGNTAVWLVFSWLVHQPWRFGQIHPPDFPRPLRAVWLAIAGRENYWGVRYHFLHHLFPSVPDRDLPPLARRLGSHGA
jgi:fatty acid desaturase